MSSISIFDSLEKLKKQSEQTNKQKLLEKDKKKDLIDNSVTKSNALSRAYYRYSLVEKRCMEALISKLHPLQEENELQEIELKALDYAEAFNISKKHSYEHLERAAHGLMRRVISVSGDGVKGRYEFTLMARTHYLKDEGKIICTFNPYIVPHLLNLRTKFSSYPLTQAISFSSSYTWRFYEVLVSWAKPKHETGGVFCGWFTIDVVDLREMLGMPDSYRWVHINATLKKAQNELINKSNIHVDVSPQKTGRRYTYLIINFIENT